MKLAKLMIGAAALSLACTAYGGKAIDDSDLGLTKESVFDTPTPTPPDYAAPAPGVPVTGPSRYFPGAPPIIPHNVMGLVPITGQMNACLGCHDKPDMIGKRAQGMPTPMPASHYQDPWAPTGGKKLAGARYNCTQCHAQQSDAQPLVENTLK